MDAFVGVVLVDDQEKIFLIKEDDKNKISQDRWNLPGGSVDGEESLIEAAERETEEETGYKVEIKSLLGVYECRKGDKSWLYVVFEARPLNRKTSPTDPEIKEGKWFNKDEFLHLGSSQIVHPDMQLVYRVVVEDKGLSIDTVKLINYDLQ
ncbi:MAG: NUDIX hydrolase [Candidatus Blackburnbacteria bacterium]|nr:NUDIX hydrolase [Candidatus Blackburnbacteria bacterium]